MRTIIEDIITDLVEGNITIEAKYSIIGAHIDFTLQRLNPPDSYRDAVRTTCTRLEIVAALQSLGIATGHDPATRQVRVCPTAVGGEACFKTLHDVYTDDVPDKTAFHRALLLRHLHDALQVLNYEGSAEDLWHLFDDYHLLEKQALVWRLLQQPHIDLHPARVAVAEITNYWQGINTRLPLGIGFPAMLFAKWLHWHDGGLLALVPVPIQKTDWTVTAA